MASHQHLPALAGLNVLWAGTGRVSLRSTPPYPNRPPAFIGSHLRADYISAPGPKGSIDREVLSDEPPLGTRATSTHRRLHGFPRRLMGHAQRRGQPQPTSTQGPRALVRRV